MIQPPIFWKPILGWWVRLAFRRDPAFAATLQTQLNPVWCRRMVAKASKKYPLELVSIGDDLFFERLAQPFAFETEMVASKAGSAVHLFRMLNVHNWMGHLVVLLQAHYPIYLTVRKGGTKAADDYEIAVVQTRHWVRRSPRTRHGVT